MNYYAGEPFLSTEIIQGYHHVNHTTHFLFDYKHYGIPEPHKVVVTGSFRQWNMDTNDPAWIMHRFSESLFILSIHNYRHYYIPPLSEFKFLINDGDWVQAPDITPNTRDGNLIYMYNGPSPSLYAEIRRSKTIWIQTEGIPRQLDPAAYKLHDAQGREYGVSSILPQTEDWMLLTPTQQLDINRVYWLSMPEFGLKSLCSFDGWFRDMYSDKALGANIEGSVTSFRLFAPRATQVKLYLYKEAEDTVSYEKHVMNQDKDGVWESLIPGDLTGIYYDFTVHGPGDPGNNFYDTHPVHISDPYARVSVDTWGKCRVASATRPASPLTHGRPKMEDVIAYEVHVQDFTDNLPVSDDLKGTIPAMIEKGLTNSIGEPIGFDYLISLGINVVHLMPVQEFLHYPDEEWKSAFENDPYMIENGINLENYQWGYRTSHAFAIETRFRKGGTDHGAQREQFRDLVQAFHDHDIAVIIDIVPNHSAENMDKDPYHFHWSVLDQQYYYRNEELELIGEYGNEIKFENRPMVQRWLIDQCKHFIEEFGIDGFRVDLAGQVDKQTLTKLRQALGEDIIIYGEPWIGSFDPEFESNPSWDWYKVDSPITFFQDDARNAFKGPTDNPKDKRRDRGYAGGNTDERENVMKGLTATFPEEHSPLDGINYLDVHDNWALADQFAHHHWDGRWGVDEERYKIAAVLLYTSLGPIVTHGGSEMMRSKGAAVLEEVVKYTSAGTAVYLHGKRDTYNMRTANQFIWENVGRKSSDDGYHSNYGEMYAFWRGLNLFRLSEYGKVFRQAEAVPKTYYQWIAPYNREMLGYIVDEKVIVFLNVGDHNNETEIQFPHGVWKLIANNTGVDHVNGVEDDAILMQLQGGATYNINIRGAGIKIWVKEG